MNHASLHKLEKILTFFFFFSGYDSGEKKRIPAWCDRILYRDNRASATGECSLECPVVASILQYVFNLKSFSWSFVSNITFFLKKNY